MCVLVRFFSIAFSMFFLFGDETSVFAVEKITVFNANDLDVARPSEKTLSQKTMERSTMRKKWGKSTISTAAMTSSSQSVQSVQTVYRAG